MGAGPGRFVVLSPSGMTWASTKIAPGAKSDFWSPKVTFRPKSNFWASKSLFTQRSPLRSRSHFSRFRPPESAKFYKHYKGFAAVARAGAKSADFAKFSGKSTFGAKTDPKVTFSIFGSQKRLVAPRRADVPVGNGFLMFFTVPGS